MKCLAPFWQNPIRAVGRPAPIVLRHQIPFVFLSGNKSPRLKEDMLRSGAGAFLDKDDPSLLIDFIRQLEVLNHGGRILP
jgi:hypothetical protein